MTFRTRLAVLVLVLAAPLYSQADPQAALDARVQATAAASSAQAVSAALAREDEALQRAIDRKVAARMDAALAPPLPVRAPRASVAAKTGAPAENFRRAYASQ